jgi:hypothetical protein
MNRSLTDVDFAEMLAPIHKKSIGLPGALFIIYISFDPKHKGTLLCASVQTPLSTLTKTPLIRHTFI